jgi:hypothetical protein
VDGLAMNKSHDNEKKWDLWLIWKSYEEGEEGWIKIKPHNATTAFNAATRKNSGDNDE